MEGGLDPGALVGANPSYETQFGKLTENVSQRPLHYERKRLSERLVIPIDVVVIKVATIIFIFIHKENVFM